MNRFAELRALMRLRMDGLRKPHAMVRSKTSAAGTDSIAACPPGPEQPTDNDKDGLVKLILSVATGQACKAAIAEFFRSRTL